MTIKTQGTSPAVPSYKLLELGDSVAAGWYYPRVLACGVAGSPISAEFVPLAVYDFVTLEVQGADNGDQVDVWFALSE